MKILWFGHRDIGHPMSGGAERTIQEIARRLVARGDEVTWASGGFHGCQRNAQVDGIRVVRARGYFFAHVDAPVLVRSLRPDIVVDDLGHVVPWFSELYSGLPGTAFFRHLHARTLPGQVAPPFAKSLTWVEQAYPLIYPHWPFVTESRQGVRDLVQLGIDESRVVQIPPGVDLERFRIEEKSNEPTIVYFGGFRDYKRPWVPVEVFSRLQPRVTGLQLQMIGAGPALPIVQRLVRDKGIEGVHFTGRIGVEALAEIVSRSWVNVHCSMSEGWGYSILEASASGTPTVAYAVPGVSETVEPGVNGILVADRDVDALVDATESVVLDHAEWIARSRIFAERFTWDVAANRWRNHFSAMIAGSSG